MQPDTRPATLDHLNLSVRDFAETAKWYAQAFGFEVVERGLYDGRPWGVLKSGDSMLCVYETPSLSAPRSQEADRFHKIYHFGLRIRDRESWDRIIASAGLKTYFDSPVRYPHSISWYVKDPTGHMIEVALWDEDRVAFN